jgi:hypothetical protein
MTLSFAFGQDKTHKIEIDKRSDVQQVINLGDAGLVIRTGKKTKTMGTFELKWKLTRLSADLDKIWEVPVEKVRRDFSYAQPLVASPTGNYVYQIQVRWDVNALILTQVNESGEAKIHKLQDIDYFPANQIFCDDTYLYFFERKYLDLDDALGKNKKPLVLIMNRMRHSDFQFEEEIVLDLPPVFDDEVQTGWEYAGHDNSGIYVFSKSVDPDHRYDVIKIDKSGNVLESISVDANMEGVDVRGSYNERLFNEMGVHQHYEDANNYDYYIEYGQNGRQIWRNLGAYGNIKMDLPNGAFYIYGLYGPKPLKEKGKTTYSGYFIQKYKLNGEQVWQSKKEISNYFKNEKTFIRAGEKTSKELIDVVLQLNVYPNETSSIRVYIGNRSEVHAFWIDATGTLQDHEEQDNRDNMLEIPDHYDTSFPPPASMRKKYGVTKDTRCAVFGNSGGDILIERIDKDEDVVLLEYFKH